MQHKQPLHTPVSIEHLLALQKAIDITLLFHAAVWAVGYRCIFWLSSPRGDDGYHTFCLRQEISCVAINSVRHLAAFTALSSLLIDEYNAESHIQSFMMALDQQTSASLGLRRLEMMVPL